MKDVVLVIAIVIAGLASGIAYYEHREVEHYRGCSNERMDALLKLQDTIEKLDFENRRLRADRERR